MDRNLVDWAISGDRDAMDLTTVGRTRDDERAVLEELASTRPVGATDRRWLLAIAGIAVAVCFGFASSAMGPSRPATGLGMDRATPPELSRPATADDPLQSAATSIPEIKLLQPLEHASVTGGQVPVSLWAATSRRVQITVLLGNTVLGWRNVATGPDGTWAGDVRVFAPPIALPATIRAAASLPEGEVEAVETIELDGGADVVLWDVSTVAGADGRQVVEFRASAPLVFAHATAWVTDAGNRDVGKTAVSSRVDPWLGGAAGGRKLGLGTLSGTIPIRGRMSGWHTLHIAWRNPITGVRGEIAERFDADAPPR